MAKTSLNDYLKVESLGSVEIHDNAEIGASSQIKVQLPTHLSGRVQK